MQLKDPFFENLGSFSPVWSSAVLIAGLFAPSVLSSLYPIPDDQLGIVSLSEDAARSWVKFTPEPDKCVFYTGNLTDEVRSWAKSTQYTTIWDVYPDEKIHPFYKEDPISRDGLYPYDYYMVLDRVYAEACSGAAWLMMPANTDECLGIMWNQVEFPLLFYNRAVDLNRIQVVDVEGKNQSLYHHAPPPGSLKHRYNCPDSMLDAGFDPINFWGKLGARIAVENQICYLTFCINSVGCTEGEQGGCTTVVL